MAERATYIFREDSSKVTTWIYFTLYFCITPTAVHSSPLLYNPFQSPPLHLPQHNGRFFVLSPPLVPPTAKSCSSFRTSQSRFHPEDGGNIFLRNVSKYPWYWITSHPRRRLFLLYVYVLIWSEIKAVTDKAE